MNNLRWKKNSNHTQQIWAKPAKYDGKLISFCFVFARLLFYSIYSSRVMLTLKMCRWKANWSKLCVRACVLFLLRLEPESIYNLVQFQSIDSPSMDSIQFVLFHKMQIWNFVFEFLFVFVRLQINFFLFFSHYLRKFANQLGMFFLSRVCLFKLQAWVNNNRRHAGFKLRSFFSSSVYKTVTFENRFVYMDLCVFNRFCPLLFRFRWLIFIFLVLDLKSKFKQWQKNGTEHTSIILSTRWDTVSLSNRILFIRFLFLVFDENMLQSDLRAQFHKDKFRWTTNVLFSKLLDRSSLDFIKINTNSIFVSASSLSIQCFFSRLNWIKSLFIRMQRRTMQTEHKMRSKKN